MKARAGLDHTIVVQAAAKLADSKGLEEVSLALLAEQLGVRSPTLYHYIERLSGLRHDLAVLGTRELAQCFGHSVMGKAADKAIISLANAYRAFVKEHPGLYAATIRQRNRTITSYRRRRGKSSRSDSARSRPTISNETISFTTYAYCAASFTASSR